MQELDGEPVHNGWDRQGIVASIAVRKVLDFDHVVGQFELENLCGVEGCMCRGGRGRVEEMVDDAVAWLLWLLSVVIQCGLVLERSCLSIGRGSRVWWVVEGVL